MHFIFLTSAGFLVGTLGTLVGIGGGIFILPLLFLVYHFSPQLAIGTSIAVVFFNTFSGAIAYAFQKRIQYGLGLRFALMTIPGAIIGSCLSRILSPLAFRIVFGALLILMAFYLFIKTKKGGNGSASKEAFLAKPSPGRLTAVYMLSLGVGVLSSFLGVGGGIIHIPVLIYILKMPVHLATATSHFILVFTSVTGAITHYWLGNIEISFALALGLGAILGAQTGAIISKRIRTYWIIILLALVLALTGIRLLVINMP